VELEHSWCMGVEVMQFDVDVFTLAKTAEWIASYYTTVVPPTDIYILSGNHSALQFITKADSLVNQRAALLFKDSLTTFFSLEVMSCFVSDWSCFASISYGLSLGLSSSISRTSPTLDVLCHVCVCHVSVMCCVAPFCDRSTCSDTSIGVVGFVTRSRIREEL
jgi:hypothetical protein